jgi:hypothetical protein
MQSHYYKRIETPSERLCITPNASSAVTAAYQIRRGVLGSRRAPLFVITASENMGSRAPRLGDAQVSD